MFLVIGRKLPIYGPYLTSVVMEIIVANEGTKINYRRKMTWLVCALILIVAPLSYAQGKWVGVAFGVGVGFLNGLGRKRNFVQGVSVGLVAGLTTGLAFSFTESILLGLLASFTTGIATTISKESEIDRRRFLIAAIVGLLMGFAMGLGLIYSKGVRGALPFIFVLAVTSGVGLPLGAVLGYWLRPRLLLFADVWLYLREMGAYLISFVVGYFTLALLFASWFWSLWKLNPSESFNNLSSTPTFGEFFYFSVVTLATLGYGDITPKSAIARGLVVSEIVLGIGWITVIFAVVMSHLQPKFAEIAKRRSGERKESKGPR